MGYITVTNIKTGKITQFGDPPDEREDRDKDIAEYKRFLLGQEESTEPENMLRNRLKKKGW